MITSPDILRKETVQVLAQVDKALASLEGEAANLNMEAHQLRDANNAQPLAPLLLAKVMAINTLVELNYSSRGR